jgi:hypothetical protein
MLKNSVALGLALFLAQVCPADTYNAYAPPNAWGTPVALRAHLGAATITISYRVVGDTVVVGEVAYFNKDGNEVKEMFNGEITIRTGNVVAQPKVRFKGIPLGSAVTVTTKP